MSLIDANWSPTDRQLRQFGVICLFALPIVGWVWGANPRLLGILALVGAGLAAVGWIAPRAIKPVFVVLMVLAIPIGWVIGELAMLLIYFGLFLPIGLAFKLIGRDALALKLNRGAATYWQEKAKPRSPSSYYRQS